MIAVKPMQEAKDIASRKTPSKREFEKILDIGKQIGATLEISEEDVMDEIKKHRKAKQQAG